MMVWTGVVHKIVEYPACLSCYNVYRSPYAGCRGRLECEEVDIRNLLQVTHSRRVASGGENEHVLLLESFD